MEKTALELRYQLKNIWGDLRYIWPWDRRYYLLDLKTLKEIVEIALKTKIYIPAPINKEVTFGELYNVGDLFDCDNFSAGGDFLPKLIGKIIAERGDIPRLPLAWGQVRGSQFRQIPMLHALNIAITQEGVYFIDFDNGEGRIWQANKDWDSIFYVSL
jgi:hypothetical protein